MTQASRTPLILRSHVPVWIGGLIWTGLAGLFVAATTADYLVRGVDERWLVIGWNSGATCWLLAGILTVPTIRLYRRLLPTNAGWLATALAFAVTFAVFHLVLQVLHVAVEQLVMVPLSVLPPVPSLERLGSALLRRSALSCIILIGIVGFDTIRQAVLGRIAEEQRAGRLQADLVNARLTALRAQLQPRFLFNTLNAIAVHLRTDPQAAESMVEQLGELLRASLSSSDDQTISLDREFELAQAYLDIQSVRFSDRLTFDTQLSAEAARVQVPPLLLQPIVENAVRHGIEPAKAGGHVSLTAEVIDGSLRIAVRDNGVGFPAVASATRGIGIANCTARLATFAGGAASLRTRGLDRGGTEVLLTLPLGAQRLPVPA